MHRQNKEDIKKAPISSGSNMDKDRLVNNKMVNVVPDKMVRNSINKGN